MKYRAPKVEVDDYTEERWKDIERSVFAELDGESHREGTATKRRPRLSARSDRNLRWKPAVAFVIAGAAAAAIGGLVLRSTPPQGPATAATAAPSRITTAGSESHVTIGEAALDVGPNSSVLIGGDDDQGISVMLDRGKVDCIVAPRRGRPPFVVTSGDVRVVVVGTRFTVDHPDGTTRVEVREGVVQVISHGETANVHAGESWPLTSPAPAIPVTNPLPDPRVAPDKSATVARPKDPTAHPSASLGSRDFPETSDEEPYEAAAKVEKSDPEAALTTYRRIAAGSGPWAPNALFAAGRLEGDRGHRAESLRLLNAYLARFPRGPNAADARTLVDRMR